MAVSNTSKILSGLIHHMKGLTLCRGILASLVPRLLLSAFHYCTLKMGGSLVSHPTWLTYAFPWFTKSRDTVACQLYILHMQVTTFWQLMLYAQHITGVSTHDFYLPVYTLYVHRLVTWDEILGPTPIFQHATLKSWFEKPGYEVWY